MKFSLIDKTYAHLWGIVQYCDYRRDYQVTPLNAAEEIKLIAQTLLPSVWKLAPLVLLAVEEEKLSELMRRKKLPKVMCLGEFVSFRKRDDGSTKPVFLHVIWLQEDFVPMMDPENEVRFRIIDWEKYGR